MSIVIYQIKNGAPTSYHLKQTNVLAKKPETGELKFIGYYIGQNSVFTEDIGNSDIKPSKVPDFLFNPTRNKCELRFDDSNIALAKYIAIHPHNGIKYELYSEDIENKQKLGKAESIEKALDYVKETDELKLRALGLAVLGLSSYNKPSGTIKALLKDKAINKPKEVVNACEDDLYEDKFIASLALCSGVVETNATMTAIVWGDNKGRILNIATGEDFITKFAQHLGSNSPESNSLRQEIGGRLELKNKAEKAQSKEVNEIASLKAQLEAMKTDLEISNNKLANLPPTQEEKEEKALQEASILEMRENYKEVTGKNVAFRFQNDMDWMKGKIKEHLKKIED